MNLFVQALGAPLRRLAALRPRTRRRPRPRESLFVWIVLEFGGADNTKSRYPCVRITREVPRGAVSIGRDELLLIRPGRWGQAATDS